MHHQPGLIGNIADNRYAHTIHKLIPDPPQRREIQADSPLAVGLGSQEPRRPIHHELDTGGQSLENQHSPNAMIYGAPWSWSRPLEEIQQVGPVVSDPHAATRRTSSSAETGRSERLAELEAAKARVDERVATMRDLATLEEENARIQTKTDRLKQQ